MSEHPSHFIYEELNARRWSVRDLVFRMRRYESERDWAINQLAVEMYLDTHNREIVLDIQMAQEFGVAFDINPVFFINLHEQWRNSAGDTSETEKKG